jgi:hypothetical protein
MLLNSEAPNDFSTHKFFPSKKEKIAIFQTQTLQTQPSQLMGISIGNVNV